MKEKDDIKSIRQRTKALDWRNTPIGETEMARDTDPFQLTNGEILRRMHTRETQAVVEFLANQPRSAGEAKRRGYTYARDSRNSIPFQCDSMRCVTPREARRLGFNV